MELKPIKPNMTELYLDNYVVLFSYETPVAYRERKTGDIYKTSVKYSNTTARHVNKWVQDNLLKCGHLPILECSQDVLDNLIKKGE